MTSPHLPPKTCNVELRRKLEVLPWIFLTVLLAIVSAIAASLIAIAWLVPGLFFSDSYSAIDLSKRGIIQPTVDSSLVRHVGQRTMTIFDSTKKTDGAYYAEGAAVAEAALLSSDGWAVAHVPTYVFGQERVWEGFDYQGNAFPVLQVVEDPIFDLLYIQFDASGLRIMSFGDVLQFGVGSTAWAMHGDTWKRVVVSEQVDIAVSDVYPVWQSQQTLGLLTDQPGGSFLVSDTGALLGFLNADGHVISGAHLESQIPNLLQEAAVTYVSIPLRGFLINGFYAEALQRHVNSAFYVSNVSASVQKDILPKDVIVAIDGLQVNKQTLSELLLSASSEVALTVLRDGEVVEIVVEKTQVPAVY